MFNFLCELHFWSLKDGIVVDKSDFGAFVYHSKKTNTTCPIYESKKKYCEGRGVAFSLNNKRPKKLKDSLLELEETFYENRVVKLEWKSTSIIQIIFDNGLQTHIKIDLDSGDVNEFVFDKFMVSKLSSYLSDVTTSSHHAIFAYNDNRVVHTYMSKPTRLSAFRKWNNLDVKLHNVELAGPSGRRLDKMLSFNLEGDAVLIWWKCGRDEVYPWSPQVKAEDRANVHIYSLDGLKLELLCYYRTKFDPVSIVFSKVRNETIYTIQQRVNDGGEVTLEWENSSLDNGNIRNNYSVSLQLPTHVSTLALSPQEDKLIATCIDGSLLVADNYGNITNRIRIDSIPSLAAWHPDGALIVVGNNKGQLQWFDSALASVSCQLTNHDSSSLILDVGSYFKYQPNLVGVHWNRQSSISGSRDHFNDFLLLQFEKGPLVNLKLIRSVERKLGADTIVYQYLSAGNYSDALNLLHTVDWEVDSELAMSTLQTVVSYLMRKPFSPSTESAIEKAFGYFLNPIRPIPDSITSDAADGVVDLAKKFFHTLLRHQCFDKAFRLAIDLGIRELFLDIYHYCTDVGNSVMATAAWERAEELCSSCDDSSESSCDSSHSSEHSQSSDNESTQEEHLKIVPPLQITSPLESARNKVCYSSILQQHNYRRNPPKIVSPVENEDELYSSGLPVDYTQKYSSLGNYSYVNRGDPKIKHLPQPSDDLNSLLEDNCFIHHPNTPSSRAPLQFNIHSLDHMLTSEVDHTDPYVGLPFSLKVANARRKNPEVNSCANSYNFQTSSCTVNVDGAPSTSYGSFPETGSSFQNNYKNDLINPYMVGELFGGHDLRRHDPDGTSSSTYESDSTQWNNSTPPLTAPSQLIPNQQTDRSVDEYSFSPANEFKYKISRVNIFPSQVQRNLPASIKTDAPNFGEKTPEPPIIASAETEDGKIKVVHFGLV